MALRGASRIMCLGWIFCSTLVLMTSTSNAAVAHDSHTIQVINVEDNSTVTTMPYNATPVSTAPPGGLIGQAVYIAPQDDACSDDVPSPPGDVNMTWIAVVALENCTVHEKAVMVERAGFAAAVFYNSPDEPNNSADEPNNSADEPKQTFVQKRQEEPEVHIMVVSVGYHNGMLLALNYSYTNRLVRVRLNSPPAVSVDVTNLIWVGSCFMTVAALVLFLRCVYSCWSSCKNREGSLQKRRFKRGDHYDTCAICMEEFVDRERVRVLPCQHVYHRHCVDPWLRYHRPTCPQCKREVDPEALGPDERSTLISERVTASATPTALVHPWNRAGLASYMFPDWASVMAPLPAYYQSVNLDRDEGRDRPYQVYGFTPRRQREASRFADATTRAAMPEQGGETAGSPTPTPTLTSPAGEEAPGNGQAMPAPRQESSGTQTRLSGIRRIKHTGSNPRSGSSDEVTSPSFSSSEVVSGRLGSSATASRGSSSSSTVSPGRPLSATRPRVWASARSLRPSASRSAQSAVSPRRSTAWESSSAELAGGAQASQQRSASTQTSITGIKRKRGGSRQPQSSYQVVSSSTSSAEQATRQSSRPFTTTTTTTSSFSPESTAVASGRTC